VEEATLWETRLDGVLLTALTLLLMMIGRLLADKMDD